MKFIRTKWTWSLLLKQKLPCLYDFSVGSSGCIFIKGKNDGQGIKRRSDRFMEDVTLIDAETSPKGQA